MSTDREAQVYTDSNGNIRVRVDAPGIAAVSATIDPKQFIQQVAAEAGITVEFSDCGD